MHLFGDTFAYFKKPRKGEKAWNIVTLGSDSCMVYCLPETLFVEHWLKSKDEMITGSVRRIPIEKFVKWYPTLLYNLTAFDLCVEKAIP
jgi:hypothetical protein